MAELFEVLFFTGIPLILLGIFVGSLKNLSCSLGMKECGLSAGKVLED